MNLYIVKYVSGGGMVPNKATAEMLNATCVTWADDCRGGAHLWRRPAKAGDPRYVGSGG